MLSYSGLMEYWRCPRRYGFKLMGFSPIEVPEPLLVGQLVHEAIFAHFRGDNPGIAMANLANDNVANLGRINDTEKKAKALQELEQATKRADYLASRYISAWASDYRAVLVEPELKLGEVIAHPDLTAMYQDQRAVVDFKTSKNPDIRWYDISGQVDLYAWMVNNHPGHTHLKFGVHDITPDITLIIYDIISDEGIYRHTRPPRLDAGQRLYQAIGRLPDACSEVLLSQTNFQFNCPQICQFWMPCYLLETADLSACQDYLDRYFINTKEVKQSESV